MCTRLLVLDAAASSSSLALRFATFAAETETDTDELADVPLTTAATAASVAVSIVGVVVTAVWGTAAAAVVVVVFVAATILLHIIAAPSMDVVVQSVFSDSALGDDTSTCSAASERAWISDNMITKGANICRCVLFLVLYVS